MTTRPCSGRRGAAGSAPACAVGARPRSQQSRVRILACGFLDTSGAAMLPPPSVLTNKKCRARLLIPLLALALGMGLTGCGPPGPRALLDGEKLIKDGRH